MRGELDGAADGPRFAAGEGPPAPGGWPGPGGPAGGEAGGADTVPGAAPDDRPAPAAAAPGGPPFRDLPPAPPGLPATATDAGRAQSPPAREILRPLAVAPLAGVYVDAAGQLAFLRRHLLSVDRGFVREGGSKLKLVLGGAGAGKTRFLEALLDAAQAEGFLTVPIRAGDLPLWGFDHLYRAVVRGLDLAAIGRRFLDRVLAECGYGPAGPAAGQGLAAWATERGHAAPVVRARLQDELHRRLLANPDLDYGYAVGLERWCEALVDIPPGASDPALVHAWLQGAKVAIRDCHRLRLRRPVDRTVGRLWLRSLLQFVRLAGYPGLVVTVDDLGVVLETPRRGLRPSGGELAPEEPGAPPEPAAGLDRPVPDGAPTEPPEWTGDERGDSSPWGLPSAPARAAGGAAAPPAAGWAAAGQTGPQAAAPAPAGSRAPDGTGPASVAAGAGAGFRGDAHRGAPLAPAGDLPAAAAPSVHYTKQRRDDLYECLRTLIDDMGLVPGLLLALAGPAELVDHPRLGFASYPALAERVRDEVQSVELNRFADEVHLERLWAADPDAGRTLAERVIEALAPDAGDGVRARAVAAAEAQWATPGVTVAGVLRSVLAAVGAGGAPGRAEAPG